MAQVDLCKELKLDKSTVAKALALMEKNKLVAKRVNPEDSRSFLVSLTPNATQIVPKIREVHSEWAKDVTLGMTDVERKLFYSLLHKVAQRAAEICKRSRSMKRC